MTTIAQKARDATVLAEQKWFADGCPGDFNTSRSHVQADAARLAIVEELRSNPRIQNTVRDVIVAQRSEHLYGHDIARNVLEAICTELTREP